MTVRAWLVEFRNSDREWEPVGVKFEQGAAGELADRYEANGWDTRIIPLVAARRRSNFPRGAA